MNRHALSMKDLQEKAIHRLDIACELDAAILIRQMRVPGGNDRLGKSVRELTESSLQVARPRALYRTASARVVGRDSVEVESIRLHSRALSRNLADQQIVFPFIATIGKELDELPLPSGSMMLKFFLDLIKTAVLAAAVDYLAAHIKTSFNLVGTAHMNPGEINDWPIAEQQPLFALFGGAENEIGVELKPSGVMRPMKSRSGIIFANENGFVSCFLCTQKQCPGRRAKYDPEKVIEYIGEDEDGHALHQ